MKLVQRPPGSLEEVVRRLEKMPGLVHHEVIPAREAHSVPLPSWLDDRVSRSLVARGIPRLYLHQEEAIDHIRAGRDVVVVTSTASGKTLCYNLPVVANGGGAEDKDGI